MMIGIIQAEPTIGREEAIVIHDEWVLLINEVSALNNRIENIFKHILSGNEDACKEEDVKTLDLILQAARQSEEKAYKILPSQWRIWEYCARFIPNTKSYQLLSRTEEMNSLIQKVQKNLVSIVKKQLNKELQSGVVHKSSLKLTESFVGIYPSASLYSLLGNIRKSRGESSQQREAFERAFLYKKTEVNLVCYIRSLMSCGEYEIACEVLQNNKQLIASVEARLVEIEVLYRTGKYSEAITRCWQSIKNDELKGCDKDLFVHKLVDTFIFQSENVSSDLLENSLREIFTSFANRSIYSKLLKDKEELLTIAFDAFDYVLTKSDRGVDLFQSILKFSSFDRLQIETFIQFAEERVGLMESKLDVDWSNTADLKQYVSYMNRFKKVLLPAIVFLANNQDEYTGQYNWEDFDPGSKLVACVNTITATVKVFRLKLPL